MLHNFICRLKTLKAKIKIIKPPEYLLIKKIINESSEKKALLVEVNDFHNEVIPGYIKYLYDLGIKCDVLVSANAMKEDVFFNIPSEMYGNIYSARRHIIKQILRSKAIEKYKYIIFSSNYNYDEHERISDSITLLQNHLDKIIFTAHHLYNLKPEDLKTKKFTILNNLTKPELENIVVNPHYFGNVNIKNAKNDKTAFLVSGGIEQRRRDYLLLKELEKAEHNNFKISAVGAKIENDLLPDFCECKGRLNFQELYKQIEKSDFILLLLDPDYPEHQKYFQSTSSGSVQLSLGFLKPCIIQKKYADTFGFAEDNAIIYNDRKDFLTAIQKAVNMTNSEYSKMQYNLKIKADKTYELSLKNLKRLLTLQD